MNDLTLDELKALLGIFERAAVKLDDSTEGRLFAQLQKQHSEREELESMDFDDCLGGACKL